MPFTNFYPLFRLSLGLWCVLMDPCFINGYKTAEELLWITLEHIQIVLNNISSFQLCFLIVYKIAEITRQLLSNTNYLSDCNETLDLVFLRLKLHKNDKIFILMSPSGCQARDFPNDLVMFNLVSWSNESITSKKGQCLSVFWVWWMRIPPYTEKISCQHFHRLSYNI